MTDTGPQSHHPALDSVLAALESWRFRYADEQELQQQLTQALDLAGLSPVREVILDGCGRIDILCGAIGIEVKVAGQAKSVQRQMARYADADQIEALVLVTTRVRHQLPETLSGKPVRVLCLATGAFA